MSEIVCQKNNSKRNVLEFPTQEMIDNYIQQGVEDLHLSGFESHKSGQANWFNFILSNGDKTN